ncbi:MAG: hypothetical protein ACK5LJ_01175 [Paracoccus sp. (in: a-proteobacteria)]
MVTRAPPLARSALLRLWVLVLVVVIYGLAIYAIVWLPWNGYGRLWADRLPTDFHATVLDIIMLRAESEAASSPSAPQT